MKLSYSEIKTFNQCERKWFYERKFASSIAKEEKRKEAYFLKEAESISAWRGQIVDTVISQFAYSEFRYGKEVTLQDYINRAKKICQEQYNFAKQHKYREEGVKKSGKNGDQNYLILKIFFEDEKEKRRVWNEIKLALENYFNSDFILDCYNNANCCLPQRAIRMTIMDTNLIGYPDMIVFFSNRAPHIFDWKVHHFGINSFREQLMFYAIMLKKGKTTHKDFPDNFREFDLVDYRLTEFQLLKNELRHYTISKEDIKEFEEKICESIYQMNNRNCHLKYGETSIENFEATQNMDICESCNFKSICWT